MPTREEKIIIAQKFNYILDNNNYLNGADAQKAFGYKTASHITNLRHTDKTQTLTAPHMQLLQLIHDIPVKIWGNDIEFDEEGIDEMIEKHQENKMQNKIEQSVLSDEAKKTFKWLKGSWYSYSYGSQANNKPEGIWIMKTIIHENLTVSDEHGNKGHLHIRKKESYIEKETKEIGDLILIRFSNNQIPYKIFRFSIQSNQIGTDYSMINYGFYARKLYTPKEAKQILGEMKHLQIKLNLDFNARIVENYKY